MRLAQMKLNGKAMGFIGGLALFGLLLALPVPEGMKPSAWRVVAITALMATWWITEAIPIPATSLLPLFCFPFFGVLPAKAAAAPYADDIIYLFMGGFFLAVTMERWNLHRRVALYAIKLVGSSPPRLVLGFMTATGFLSMWVSNTATAMMMVPIGLAVVSEVTGLTPAELRLAQGPSDNQDLNFGKALMLGIAFAASIGGLATIIGTPPNAILVGIVKKMYNYEITFLQWMMVGLPLATVTMIAAWMILALILYPTKAFRRGSAIDILDKEIQKLGSMSREEKKVLAIACCMASLWIVGGFVFKHIPMLKMVKDSTIAMGGTMLLFCVPVNFAKNEFLLDWKTAVKIPWDVVLLFGGGLALANAFQQTELTLYIAQEFKNLTGLHTYILMTIICIMTIALTEVTSNTATATLMTPIMGTVAVALGLNPIGPMLAAAISASYAFMLPVATPPNAVAYGSGCFTIRNMAASGMWINMVSFILIPLTIYVLVPLLWGENLNILPEWAKVITGN